MAYIIPALTFIRLLDSSSHDLGGSSAPSSRQSSVGGEEVRGVRPFVSGRHSDSEGTLLAVATHPAVAPSQRSAWVWRRRKAICLLIFGIVSGIACTDAILGAVKEEAVVVQLAQKLAAHEAVMADTSRCVWGGGGEGGGRWRFVGIALIAILVV